MEQLLVPIKVQALVIDDLVIRKRGALRVEDKYTANSGRWASLSQDYRKLTSSLSAPGPKPFFGATRKFEQETTDQLLAPSSVWPKDQDRGVYVHWVLPSGLRHSYKNGPLEFPALPDQWVIVRFCRRNGEAQKAKAWFLDSGLLNDRDAPGNLLFAGAQKYEARNVGKVVPLEEFAADKFQGDRTTITAIGNSQTGSPTFTAFVAENRNILSFHDPLNDLRAPANTGSVPKETTLTYLLLGWYRNEQNEPLKAIRAQLDENRALLNESPATPADVLNAIGWATGSDSPSPNVLDRSCLFHGMVAHVNYWSSTYKGTMLGYPGSPPVEDVAQVPTAPFRVGVGNSAEDALVSLVSSPFSGQADRPNLWRAIEAVIYRQPESLVGSWNTAPRDHVVHQHWFATVEAGKVWSIRARAGDQNAFPKDAAETAKQTDVKPTAAQLAALKQLNQQQSEADALNREIAALQQDLYAWWWKLTAKSYDPQANLDEETEDCRKLIERLRTLRTERDRLLDKLRPLPKQLADTLPQELELRSDSAPRFWAPADPVIVVQNSGTITKHQFPNPLPCRLPQQISKTAEVAIKDQPPHSFNTATGVNEIAAAMKHFAPRAEVLASLLNEASLVEQAVSKLAERTLPANHKQFFTARDWTDWVARLVRALERKGDFEDQIRFRAGSGDEIVPDRLVDLWERQPWSPLFVDWQVTWFPATPQLVSRQGQNGKDFGPVWPFGKYDFNPLDLESLRSVVKQGIAIRGRSLLSPIDGRIFKEPIDTLRNLLKPAAKEQQNHPSAFPEEVAKVLRDYEVVWDKTLAQLESSGLMGQALTGFHQALLDRDVTLPRITPDSTRPWIDEKDLTGLENDVKLMLETTNGVAQGIERLAPPVDPQLGAVPFSTIRSGAFRIDELWLVDDFGQYTDLLGPSAERSSSSGQVFHPRVRWHENPEFIAMPPRVLQPARVNFRFTSAGNNALEADSNPTLSSICGWMFYNPLDQALVLCEPNGRLAGELAIIKEQQNRWRVEWQSTESGRKLAHIGNDSLRTFAEALEEKTATPTPKLLDLLKLIDFALQRIRPASARRDVALFGRPLALVSATLGLELFGKAWSNPTTRAPGARPANTGDPLLDDLLVRVNLGCAHNTEDGLIGYFTDADYKRLIVTHLPDRSADFRSAYISQKQSDSVCAGFRAPVSLTLLMDPWGSVQAACGLVPAKTITLAHAELDKVVAQLETSFRVGPVLLQGDRLALPVPAGDRGTWTFTGPSTNHTAAAVTPVDARYFSDQPVVASEGRLVLITTKES
jgi:hypothetical protein